MKYSQVIPKVPKGFEILYNNFDENLYFKFKYNIKKRIYRFYKILNFILSVPEKSS